MLRPQLPELASSSCDAVNLISGLWMQHTDVKQPATHSQIVLTINKTFFSPCLSVFVSRPGCCSDEEGLPGSPVCRPLLPWQRPIFPHSCSSFFCPSSPSCFWPSCPLLPHRFPFLPPLLPHLGRHSPAATVSPGPSGSMLAHIMRKKMVNRALCTWML